MDDYREVIISTDELTGLLEKQAFYDSAQELIDSADVGQELVFIFFDMDNFKIFNANYGFEKGDKLLKSIGQVIREEFQGALISRFSGDHFMVCTNSSRIIPLIKDIREKVSLYQENVNVELKAGIYVYNGDEKDVIKCCDRARMACVSIKKKYDNEYRFYDNELEGNLKRKQNIIDRLDEALENKYIQVYYQPIVRSLTGEVAAWEALVRWIDPVQGVVYPNDFIPVLEEYRLIFKIDIFVVEEVLNNYKRLIGEGKKVVPTSINLSRIDFEVLDLVSYLDETMSRLNCPKDMFCFEVTESALAKDGQYIIDQITCMRQHGYKVWIDDFGSGYSSLNVLKNFSVDLVKIDMDFLNDFDTNYNAKILLRHIVSMLKNLKIHTLIEGVENQEQYEFLKGIGCELIQGYLIGRPMPYDESLECVTNDGRELEDYNLSSFFDDLGMVDILKQNPLVNGKNIKEEKPIPLAIGIVDNGHWEFVYANQGYKEGIRVFDYETMEIVEDMINGLNNESWMQREHFWDLCRHSKTTKSVQSMDFTDNGKIINMRVSHVAEDEINNRDAYLVSIRTLASYLTEDNNEKITAITKHIFNYYECIDMFAIENNFYDNAFQYDSRLQGNYENMRPKEIIMDIAENRVHPDDRKHFLDFMDMGTFEERINNEKSPFIIGFFRIKDGVGVFKWKYVSLSLVEMDGRKIMLSCVSQANMEIAKRMDESQDSSGTSEITSTVYETNTESDILRNILQLMPLGVFWKDKNRRFLGANKMFLDYYGFEFLETILGKTDEDMGWHINPEPFKQDELAVINEGKIIQNVPGECIVRGEVRLIEASKQPYYVDGVCQGLVGFFRDVTERKKLEKISMTDAMTGLYNRRGFNEIIIRYINQYKEDNSDFAIIVLDVDKFKNINDMYGHEFGDDVLKAVARGLRYVAADNSVVIRLGGDEFVVIHQYKNLIELDSIMEEIRVEFSKITKIKNRDVRVSASMGMALYSESKDIEDALDLADKRMYSDKTGDC